MSDTTLEDTTPPAAWTELIVALALLAKHQANEISPFHCEHDTLTVMADPEKFTPEELTQLDEWGFFPDEDGECFTSFRYGSA
ncbi:hypothetical protein GV792_04835 [Nocardia cyriacigeorgica]|uniref:hypothetical protein n=1 Tax=Nocardia cyriacigeorgica TaxID=135487 RepID=UPI0013BBBD1F|nr:hypothetical protein [Nocardia cyriacigeorgica]NEW49369.1 hypothetical protein [Nocardia cyriacigeorgica]